MSHPSDNTHFYPTLLLLSFHQPDLAAKSNNSSHNLFLPASPQTVSLLKQERLTELRNIQIVLKSEHKFKQQFWRKTTKKQHAFSVNVQFTASSSYSDSKN